MLERSPEQPPLQPRPAAPDKRDGMGSEKRDQERVALEGQVKGEVMVFQPMTILDISLGGAQIETTFVLQIDSLHDFRLSLGHRSVVVKGRVVHCHVGELTDTAARYRSGIEFLEVSPHASGAISDFVAALAYARSASRVVDGIVVDDADAR
jgi:hypothetical protein